MNIPSNNQPKVSSKSQSPLLRLPIEFDGMASGPLRMAAGISHEPTGGLSDDWMAFSPCPCPFRAGAVRPKPSTRSGRIGLCSKSTSGNKPLSQPKPLIVPLPMVPLVDSNVETSKLCERGANDGRSPPEKLARVKPRPLKV